MDSSTTFSVFGDDEELLANVSADVDIRGNPRVAKPKTGSVDNDEDVSELRTLSRSSSSAFYIEAEVLGSPAPRPRHLESRIESRSPLQYSAESNRAAFLEERRTRLRQHLSRIEEVLARNQAELDVKRDTLTQKLLEVEQNRAKLHEQRRLSVKRIRQRTSSSVADGSSGKAPAAAVDEKAKREEAASILQAAWRLQKYRQLVAEMARRKLSLGNLRETSFSDLVHKIQEPSTIKAMARFLLGIKAVSPESSSIDFKNPARVFLSAYVIVGHPNEIIHSNGPAESRLKDLAGKMLTSFERLATETGASTGPKDFSDALLVFVGDWVHFYSAFDDWKQADTHKVVGELVAHWLELERLWLSVRAEMHADAEWRGRVEHQQEQIRNRIKKVAGDAGIARLVEEARRARAESGLDDEDELESPLVPSMDEEAAVNDNGAYSPPRRSVGSGSAPGSASGSPLRKVAAIDPYSSSPKRFPSSMEKRAMTRHTDSVTSSRASSAPGTPTRNLSQSSSFADLDSAPALDGIQPAAHEDMSQDWPGFGGPTMSNQQLAHELVMDPDFQLQAPKRSQLEENIRAAARKAFFDSVREDFARSEYGRYALGLIDEAKKALSSMLREEGKIGHEVNDVLDLPLLSQQISRGTYDLKQTTGYILCKMSQLCAPARDARIRELIALVDTDLTAAWDGLLVTLDDMKLDLANFRLQQLRPKMVLEAVEYERKKFDEGLERGRYSLTRTTNWLEVSAKNLVAIAAARNPENLEIDTTPRFEDIYNDALLSLIFGTTAVNPSTCPETIAMDAERLFAMQNDGQAITIVAALLVLSKNMVTELRTNDAAAIRLKSRLMTMLKDPEGGISVENLAVELISAMNGVLADKPRPTGASVVQLTAEQEGMVRTMVDKTLTYKDTVFAMMQRRVQDKARQTLQSGLLPTTQSLVSSGLDSLSKELVDLCKRIVRLAKHDREVHGRHYDAIIRSHLYS